MRSFNSLVVGKTEPALRDARACLTLDSSYAVLLLAAKCFQQMPRIDSAIVYASASVRSNDSCLECRSVLGDLLLSRGDYCEASDVFRRLVTYDPNPQNFFRYASAVASCKPEVASSLLEDLYEQTHDVHVLLELLSIYEILGKTDELYATLDRCVRELPAGMFPQEAYIGTLSSAKQFDRLLTMAETRIPLLDSVQRRELLGQLHDAMYDQLDASDTVSLKRLQMLCAEYDSSNSGLMFSVGRMAFEKNVPATGVEALMHAALSDSTAQSFHVGALYLLDRGDTASLTLFVDGIEHRFHDDIQYCLLKASLLLQRASFTEALFWFERAAEGAPSDEGIFVNIAICQTRLKQNIAAERTYEQIISINPHNHLALNNVAYSYACSKRQRLRAVRYARLALSLDSANLNYLDTYAWALYASGRYSEAEREFAKLLGLQQDNPTFFEHAGDTYSKLGLKDQAKAAWKRALELDGTRTYLQRRID